MLRKVYLSLLSRGALALLIGGLGLGATPDVTAQTRPQLPAPRPDETRLRPAGDLKWPRPTFPDISAQLAALTAAGTRGVLIETSDGRQIMSQSAERLFNPASATKLATALVALRTFGPQFRFSTVVWSSGSFDMQTGTIDGDLVISGHDPAFHDEHAVMLARELNRLGVKTVTGNLIVPPRFTMNFSSSARRSGNRLYDTLDATLRPAAATRAWQGERLARGDAASLQGPPPSVAVMGDVLIDSVPPGARTLLTHRSSPLVDILKVLLCYSNNFMADRVGESLGGPLGIQRSLIDSFGLSLAEVRLSSASGLGTGRITPRAMMRVYRALVSELARHNLRPTDIMPVGGIDPGTLEKRFTAQPSRGSVVAKTGTLPRTDGGVSALVGQMRAADGATLYFVIFDQRGNVRRFRETQDTFLTALQHLRGGPAAFSYQPQTLAMRLTETELDPALPRTDEFEPAAN